MRTKRPAGPRFIVLQLRARIGTNGLVFAFDKGADSIVSNGAFAGIDKLAAIQPALAKFD